MDGGLSMILLGDRAGIFTPLAPHQCGLVIPGDAVAVGTPDLDADGRPDLAITENNGQLHVLLNASQSK